MGRARQVPLALFGIAAACAWPGSARAAEGPPAKALTVVIDAGHGGSNTGAPGRQGASEKQITLAVTRLLRKRLHKLGVDAMLTRDRDVYVTLAERMRRANSLGGDLFLSIHGNSSPEHALVGPEAYVTSREITDVAADHATAASGGGAEAMIARAGARQVAAESMRLGRAILRRLAVARGCEERKVHQAPYDVLDGVKVPAVLVEVGYVDHPVEGEELLSLEVLGAIADAIADGIEDYANHREGPAPRAPVAQPPPHPAAHQHARRRP